MKKMMISAAMLYTAVLAAQKVGINTTDPKTTLDINGIGGNTDTAGLQAPRLTRQELTQKGNTLYGQDHKGALIYVTDVTGGNANGDSPRKNVIAAGYYYFDGTEWKAFSTGTGSVNVIADNGLTKTGDNVQLGGALNKATIISGISAANKLSFTGTGVDAINFDENTLSINATSDRVGIGTNAPAQKLDVEGNTRISGKAAVGDASLTAALAVRNVEATEPVLRLASADRIIKFVVTDDGKTGINTATPSEQLDVNGNVRFRSVPSNTVNSTDKVLMLTSAGTGNLANISDIIPAAANITTDNGLTKTGDNIQLGGVLTKDTNVGTSTAGYNITFGGNGKMGIGTLTPTEKLDVLGNVRFRSVPNQSTIDATDRVMVLASDGTGKKVPASLLQTTITANNGLTKAGDNIKLGGVLTEDTNVGTTASGYNLTFGGEGKIGIGNTGTPTEKLDVAGGNVRFRGVPNAATLAGTDRIMALDTNGVGKKVTVSTLKDLIDTDTNTNLYTTDGTLSGNRTVTLGGNNLKFNGNGNVGISIADTAPTEKLDIGGTIKLRNVPNGTTDNKVLVIDDNGVVKKSSLPPAASFGMFATSTNVVTRNADNTFRSLAFENDNKTYPDYINRVNNTTFRAVKRGVYSVNVTIKMEDVPDLTGETRVGCSGQLTTGGQTLSIVGDKWAGNTGTVSLNRSVILNAGQDISVSTACARAGNVTYKTSTGSTIFVTYQPL